MLIHRRDASVSPQLPSYADSVPNNKSHAQYTWSSFNQFSGETGDKLEKRETEEKKRGSTG